MRGKTLLVLLLGAPWAFAQAQRGAPVKPVPADRAAEQALVGDWQLVADDDAPGQKVSEEVMTFMPDGTWKVATAAPAAPDEVRSLPANGGRYRVERNQLVLTTVVEGNTRVTRRGYKLDAEGLHLVKKVEGSYAHYKRMKPPGK